MSNLKQLEMGEAVTGYYMPYAMKTIIDRSLPDVRDGLKPIHRRILYKMYEIGLSHNKPKMKCHPLVGKVLEIHNHGDSSVYDALAKLTNQNESLLHPFIEGEGSFGKVYDTDSPSASRYTYARLNKFANEMFDGLNKEVVNFIGEDYKQPITLPNTFPNILIKPNNGMAVGFACNFPSFNLKETCEGTIEYIKNPDVDLLSIMNIDFSTGATMIYNKKEMKQIFDIGKGSVTLRAKYRVDGNYIEIYEIPYNTSSTAIIKKVNEILLKGNTLKEITDIRDESEFNHDTNKEELKLVIEVKKNTNVDLLMAKLYKNTPLESVFSCNMNCIVDNKPKLLGVKDILSEWLKYRIECIEKSLKFDIDKKSAKLHELRGLEKVLSNIDEVIKIIRNTTKDTDVIPNLMAHLNIDEIQANYIAEIKLRNLNNEYILKRVKDIESLESEVKELSHKLSTPSEVKNIIIEQLENVKNQYGRERKTEIVYPEELTTVNLNEIEVEDYNVKLYLTNDGYLKKVAATSLRGNSKQNLKDNDFIVQELDTSNRAELLIFTDQYNTYKLKAHELSDTKLSNLGEFLPALLQLKDENIVYITATVDYKEDLLIGFNNGKLARININAYKTKQNRKKLENTYNRDSKAIYWNTIKEDIDLGAISNIDKVIIMNTSNINAKSSKTTVGVTFQKSKSDSEVVRYFTIDELESDDKDYFKTNSPGIGKFLRKTDKLI
ncbi:DNA topoisomerase (ATP-hydrolyzing) subunit A [Priestia flexa]|uniref:DNA gyrase/topoisomerase IV subunit A n=1 Tax=Priestia flexa TaxID=86664 RepID=UPI00055572E6|nr:DNA topoisomerase (ATP-hydrolyzing) subunit A [Priestia flexa]